MDRQQTIGIVLMVALVIGFMWLKKPTPEEIEQRKIALQKEQQQNQQNENGNKNQIQTDSNELNNLNKEEAIEKKIENDSTSLGILYPLAKGETNTSFLKNDLLQIEVSTLGGVIRSVLLNDYKTYKKEPLYLLDNENHNENFIIKLRNSETIDLRQLYFNETRNYHRGDSIFLELSAQIANGKKISQTYSLKANQYMLKHSIDLSAIETEIEPTALIKWNQRFKRIEEHIDGILGATNKSSINYYDIKEQSFEDFGESTDRKEDLDVENDIAWLSFKQKFFNSSIVSQADQVFKNARLTVLPGINKDTTYFKTAVASFGITATKGVYNYNYLFGPNDYNVLSEYSDVATDLDHNVYLGWALFALINEWLILPLFDFLDGYFTSYGLIIILMVFIIKLVLSPLSYKSYVSMAKMKVLKPELDEIKEKHGKDQAKQQQEQMKLYNQFGISPLSGCIPMLLQMPILLALFYFFPNSIELRQQSFLWSHDLSTYDDVIKFGFAIPFLGSHISIFTLLMTVSSILYTWMNNQMSNVQGPMKNIGYIAPVIFFFVLNSYPAGLTFYYFVSNLVTFGQQAIIKKTINETKIRAKLEENKKKNANKKKSGWRAKLDEAMKKQQETQTKRKKGSTKKKK